MSERVDGGRRQEEPAEENLESLPQFLGRMVTTLFPLVVLGAVMVALIVLESHPFQ